MTFTINPSNFPKPLRPFVKIALAILSDPWQLIRYLVGGFSAFIVDFTVYYLLVTYLHITPALTAWVGMPIVLTYAFSVQKYFTFRSRQWTKAMLLRYVALILENNLITTVGLSLMVNLIGIDFRLAKVLIMFVIVANNFPLFKFWVFKQPSL